MEYPIAGFVFDTMSSNAVSGTWYEHEIQPMDEYSPKAAMKLIDEYLSCRNESETLYLDEVLDRFIVLQQENLDDEEEVRERTTLLEQNNSESEKTLAAIEEVQGEVYFSMMRHNQLHQPNDSRDPGSLS